MKMLRLFFLLFVLLGCRDDGLYYVKEIKPDIIVHPTTLDFGHLLSGYETKTDRVTVINAGNSDLFLDDFLFLQ